MYFDFFPHVSWANSVSKKTSENIWYKKICFYVGFVHKKIFFLLSFGYYVCMHNF